MKRKGILVLSVFAIVFSFSSCKVSKQYVQYVSKKENIEAPNIKKVIVISTDNVSLREFKKTFDKNFRDNSTFSFDYLDEFSKKMNVSALFADVSIDASSKTYSALNKNDADYVIHFSNFEITNRVESRQTGGMGMNGMGGMSTTTTLEYCVITVKVEIYDAKTDKEILDFVAIGEESVFLFNFTKTFQKAKEKSIDHIINYLKSGQTEYKIY